MRIARTQKGMSTFGWLAVIAGGGFVLLCLFRMAPVYLDDRYIQEALSNLGNEADLGEMTNSDIRKKLSSFFVVNNIRSQSAKDVEIERKRDFVKVSMNYEVRVPIAYNISAVMSFNHVWDSRRPYECCKPDSE